MLGDPRKLSLVAIILSLLALMLSGWAMMSQKNHRREMEALGELIRQSSTKSLPVMEMGPLGGGQPKLDRGE